MTLRIAHISDTHDRPSLVTSVTKALNALPTQPGIPCKHEDPSFPTGLGDWFQCPKCMNIWDHRPKPWEVGQHTLDDLCAEISRRLGLLSRP